ncbi:MAG TPA: hypothetical protein VJA94_17515, partial [Candidatus Angelobacter sp.]
RVAMEASFFTVEFGGIEVNRRGRVSGIEMEVMKMSGSGRGRRGGLLNAASYCRACNQGG